MPGGGWFACDGEDDLGVSATATNVKYAGYDRVHGSGEGFSTASKEAGMYTYNG